MMLSYEYWLPNSNCKRNTRYYLDGLCKCYIMYRWKIYVCNLELNLLVSVVEISLKIDSKYNILALQSTAAFRRSHHFGTFKKKQINIVDDRRSVRCNAIHAVKYRYSLTTFQTYGQVNFKWNVYHEYKNEIIESIIIYEKRCYVFWRYELLLLRYSVFQLFKNM